MSDTLSPVIEAIHQLSPQDYEALKAHLQALEQGEHLQELSVEEIRQIEVTNTCSCCPRCLSFKIIGWGSYRGRKRFMCQNCERTFNELTGTVWHYLHKHEKFKKFIDCIAQQKSIRACASEVGVCIQTAFYWRHKLLNAFFRIEQNTLKEEIQADDTYFLVSHKGQKDIRTTQQRAPRKRGTKASKSGISDEQICVMVAADCHNNTRLEVAGKGRLTKKMVHNTLQQAIRKQRVHRAVFVTDRHNAYPEFVRQKRLIHQTVIAQYKQYTNIEGYNINRVNAIHSRLKRWMRPFNGVATKYLHNYLNYFRLWDKVNSFKERVTDFLRFSTRDNQAFIRCCDIGTPTKV